MNEGKISILIVEDHQIISVGLKLLLQQIPDFDVVGEASTGKGAVEMIGRLRPDIVLMDIGLPDIDGIEATYQGKTLCPRTHFIMLTSHQSEQDIYASLGAGASGYCFKDVTSEQLQFAIREVRAGRKWLTPEAQERLARVREHAAGPEQSEIAHSEMLDILCYLEQGLSNVEIAAELNVTVDEVREYLRQTVEKLFLADSLDYSKTKPVKQWRKQMAAQIGDFAIDAKISCANLLMGEVFEGKYLIESLIGRGGMGRVYKARHMHMDRQVAIKILLPQFADDRRLIRFFKDEAKAASTLVHPNVVQIFDFGVTSDGQAFLVMDYVEGNPLDSLLRSNFVLTDEQFFSIFDQICSGLRSAHNKSIIHCDLKPSNVLLITNENNFFSVRLIDFGLAKIVPPAKCGVQLQLTDSFELSGSPAYMSPEQCRGGRVDARTDLYSLGCIMYEALTGKQAVDGRTPMECISKHLEEVPMRFELACPDTYIPYELQAITFKLLEKNPDLRFQTVDDLQKALREAHERLLCADAGKSESDYLVCV